MQNEEVYAIDNIMGTKQVRTSSLYDEDNANYV